MQTSCRIHGTCTKDTDLDRTVLKVFCFKTLAVMPILIGQCKTCSCFKTLAVTPILIGQCKTCSVSLKTLTVTQILTGQYEGCSCFKTLAVTSADFHRAMRNAFLFQNASSQLCLGLDLIICQPELLKFHTLFFPPAISKCLECANCSRCSFQERCLWKANPRGGINV